MDTIIPTDAYIFPISFSPTQKVKSVLALAQALRYGNIKIFATKYIQSFVKCGKMKNIIDCNVSAKTQ